jgi:hypothetical protein
MERRTEGDVGRKLTGLSNRPQLAQERERSDRLGHRSARRANHDHDTCPPITSLHASAFLDTVTPRRDPRRMHPSQGCAVIGLRQRYCASQTVPFSQQLASHWKEIVSSGPALRVCHLVIQSVEKSWGQKFFAPSHPPPGSRMSDWAQAVRRAPPGMRH